MDVPQMVKTYVETWSTHHLDTCIALFAPDGDIQRPHNAGANRGAQSQGALGGIFHWLPRLSSSADLLLPASTPWETEALKPTFALKGCAPEAAAWAQLRKAIVPPLANTRSDLSVIFDLACRL